MQELIENAKEIIRKNNPYDQWGIVLKDGSVITSTDYSVTKSAGSSPMDDVIGYKIEFFCKDGNVSNKDFVPTKDVVGQFLPNGEWEFLAKIEVENS